MRSCPVNEYSPREGLECRICPLDEGKVVNDERTVHRCSLKTASDCTLLKSIWTTPTPLISPGSASLVPSPVAIAVCCRTQVLQEMLNTGPLPRVWKIPWVHLTTTENIRHSPSARSLTRAAFKGEEISELCVQFAPILQKHP